MSNEEKVRELSSSIVNENFHGILKHTVEQSLMDVAKWKDSTYKSQIDELNSQISELETQIKLLKVCNVDKSYLAQEYRRGFDNGMRQSKCNAEKISKELIKNIINIYRNECMLSINYLPTEGQIDIDVDYIDKALCKNDSIITNECKAKELSSKYARQYCHNNCFMTNDKSFVFSNEEIKTACDEMAEWKDEKAIKAFCSIRCAEDSDNCTRECPFKQAFVEELKNE